MKMPKVKITAYPETILGIDGEDYFRTHIPKYLVLDTALMANRIIGLTRDDVLWRRRGTFWEYYLFICGKGYKN